MRDRGPPIECACGSLPCIWDPWGSCFKADDFDRGCAWNDPWWWTLLPDRPASFVVDGLVHVTWPGYPFSWCHGTALHPRDDLGSLDEAAEWLGSVIGSDRPTCVLCAAASC